MTAWRSTIRTLVVAVFAIASVVVATRLSRRLFESPDTAARTTTDTVVFPVRSRLRLGGGIGIQNGTLPPSYFWTSQQPTILSALAGCGFTVKWEEALAELW